MLPPGDKVSIIYTDNADKTSLDYVKDFETPLHTMNVPAGKQSLDIVSEAERSGNTKLFLYNALRKCYSGTIGVRHYRDVRDMLSLQNYWRQCVKVPFDHYGIVPGDVNLFLTEEPVEIEHGIYIADAVDAFGNHHEVELEGWGDGDFDMDNPLDAD